MNCPDEKKLSSYLDERLGESERSAIEGHLAGCSRCLDFIVLADEARNFSARRMRRLARKIKGIFFGRVYPGGRVDKKKAGPEAKWLFGALFLFALSFIFRGYFLQFLIAAAVLGFKWAMEGEGAKRAIMIFKGIKPEKFERKSLPPVSRISGGDRDGEER